jgi:plastocyanin
MAHRLDLEAEQKAAICHKLFQILVTPSVDGIPRVLSAAFIVAQCFLHDPRRQMMTRHIDFVSTLSAATAIVFAFGCATDPEETAVEQASNGHTEIHPEDDCDPVTFGALCRPGFPGQTTLDSFRAQFAATFRVAGWEYGGGEIRVNLGQNFRVDNQGGEAHTFTVVKSFGGGRVAPLNNPNEAVAPECVAGASASNVDIASGAGITVTTGATGVIKSRGTFRIQCCIHPWMRTTAQIR